MPYTPVGVFLIDQWRQIGVTAEHEQPETRAYIANLRSGNYEVGLDFNCDFIDDRTCSLQVHLRRRSPINYGRYNDETLDKLYEPSRPSSTRTSATRSCASSRSMRWNRPIPSRPSGGTASS